MHSILRVNVCVLLSQPIVASVYSCTIQIDCSGVLVQQQPVAPMMQSGGGWYPGQQPQGFQQQQQQPNDPFGAIPSQVTMHPLHEPPHTHPHSVPRLISIIIHEA